MSVLCGSLRLATGNSRWFRDPKTASRRREAVQPHVPSECGIRACQDEYPKNLKKKSDALRADGLVAPVIARDANLLRTMQLQNTLNGMEENINYGLFDDCDLTRKNIQLIKTSTHNQLNHVQMTGDLTTFDRKMTDHCEYSLWDPLAS